MKKKNGFIATSLIYSFFLVFITQFLTIIADYLQNKVLLNTIENDIKEDLNGTKNIADFNTGDIIVFQFTNDSYSSLKCGISLSNITNVCNNSNLDEKSFRIDSFEVKDGEKVDTIKLINTADESDVLYIYRNNLKFRIQDGIGITITEVLS